MTIWEQILGDVRTTLPEEDFRRWFGATAYASDSGDQITVWVPSEAIRRHIQNHYNETVQRALIRRRAKPTVRFVVGGTDEDDED
jgi:chromosomal replication initiation ATPase DnaA